MGTNQMAHSNHGSKNGSHIVVDRIVPSIHHDNNSVKYLSNITDYHNLPSSIPAPPGTQEMGRSHVLAYVLVPLGSLVFIALLSFLVVIILRKSKLDKLRHHLMPLYNFDPAEEGGDWESELLEEDKEQQVTMRLTGPSPTGGPKLKFTADSMDA